MSKINRYSLKFWKPMNSGEGSALFFAFRHNPDNAKENSFFMEMIPQIKGGGERDFDSKGYIRAKLNLNDAGSFLAVLNGLAGGMGAPDDKKGYKGLYHKNEKGSTIINFAINPQKEGTYRVSMYADREGDKKNFYINLTLPEVMQMKAFFEKVTPFLFEEDEIVKN